MTRKTREPDADDEPFGASYYDRFYRDPRTRVTDAGTTAKLARFVLAYAEFLGVRVDRVLDLGCGFGWWREPIAEARPRARYLGVERSEHLIETHGWQRGSVVDFVAKKPFDLVICQGVLQYLPLRDAGRALDNLARLARGGLLYLEVLTSEDWRDNCDRQLTDRGVHLRRGDWYRRRLRPAFVNCGGGVFVHREAKVVTFDLEQLGG